MLLACPGFEALCRSLTARHVRAVMFHRFCSDEDGDRRHLDRDALLWQIRYLVRHHTTWTPDDHLEALGARWPGGRCPVVITVDDGYRDFADIAFPLFRDHDVPVMFFVTTGFVDGRLWFWWDKLTFVLEKAGQTTHELQLAGDRVSLDLATETGRDTAWHSITDHGRILPDHEKEALVERVARDLGVPLPATPPERYQAIAWETLRAMVEQGLQVGAHTLSHAILSRVDLGRAREEIEGSRDELERQLQRPVSWFCYPQGGLGDYTRAVRDLVAEGFRGCYVAHPAPEDPADPFTLPRYSVSRDLSAFRWSMCGAEHLAQRLRRLVRRDAGVGVASSRSGQRVEPQSMRAKSAEESS